MSKKKKNVRKNEWCDRNDSISSVSLTENNIQDFIEVELVPFDGTKPIDPRENPERTERSETDNMTETKTDDSLFEFVVDANDSASDEKYDADEKVKRPFAFTKFDPSGIGDGKTEDDIRSITMPDVLDKTLTPDYDRCIAKFRMEPRQEFPFRNVRCSSFRSLTEILANVALAVAAVVVVVHFAMPLIIETSEGHMASAVSRNDTRNVSEYFDEIKKDMTDVRTQLEDLDARLSVAMEPVDQKDQETQGIVSQDILSPNQFTASLPSLEVTSHDLDLLSKESGNLTNGVHDGKLPPEDAVLRAADRRIVADYIRVMNESNADPDALAESLVKWTRHYDVPLRLAVGVAHVESNFRPDAVGIQTSSGKAVGSMQVMYSVHSALLNAEGIKTSEEVMTIDGGIRAGCYILSRYIKAEKSVTSALGRYFSRLDGNYILRKVLASALTFEQYRTGGLPIDGIKIAHEKESRTMGLLISYAPAPARKPNKGSGSGGVVVKKGFARITPASPPKQKDKNDKKMTVFQKQ